MCCIELMYFPWWLTLLVQLLIYSMIDIDIDFGHLRSCD